MRLSLAPFVILPSLLIPGCASTEAVRPSQSIPAAQGAVRPVNDRPLPAPYATPSARNGSSIIDRPSGAELNLPPGFQIREFAPGFSFQRPRFMLLGSDGEILVSDSSDQGSVFVLQDTDGDGTADRRHLLVEGIYRPYGLAFWKEYLYVAGTVELRRWRYEPRQKAVLGEGETILSWPEFQRGHWTRTIVFNRSGTKMFISIGSGSNVDAGEDPRRAAINVYNPDGSGHELFAEGLRNAVGLDFYPESDELWATAHERDALGDDLVPDYFTSVRQGDFLGWPYAYIGPNEDPRRQGENPEMVARTRPPDVLLDAHGGAMDFEFYTGSSFPAEYHGGAFIALHGSWNRSQRVGYRVDFVPFREGRPVSGPRPFLTGWMLGPDRKEVWGRPVGILQLGDGSLLISDDGGNRIWRVGFRP